MAKNKFVVYPADRLIPTIKAKIFLQDPLIAKEKSGVGIAEISLPNEACIGAGPTSSRVSVVDYNADRDELFKPVVIKSDGCGFKIGRKEPGENLYFHQVNVWAVITNILNMLEGERFFGRRIPWAFKRGRLLVLPHAGYWENAFYDRTTGALHFFYFEDQKGNPVYTCLSHDIVTHELGHAVLDGLKPYYNEISSAATAGFHEYFGDAIAMTSTLSHKDIVIDFAGRGEGDLSVPNVIAHIAAEFGKATSPDTYGTLADYYLRSGLNDKTMEHMEGVYEEHLFSEVLTGIYYDLLQRYYEELLENAEYAGPKNRHKPNVRVRALMSAAGVVARMLLRALDYCPPVDIDYADYARAVFYSDLVAYPLDPSGFREIAWKAFIKRKIISKKTGKPALDQILNKDLRNLDVEHIGASETDAYHFIDANRLPLSIPPSANIKVVHVYHTRKTSVNNYKPPREIIIEFVWPEQVRINGTEFGELNGTKATLWCGGTLVFDYDGNLRHYTVKNNTPERQKNFLNYIAYLSARGLITIDDGETGLGARGRGANFITARVVNGELRMTKSAAFRHARRGVS
jgi:hypothetical protein